MLYKILLVLIFATLTGGTAWGDDWPTYRSDHSRSGTTAETLDAPRLTEQWVWRSAQPPMPAWPGPAKWDAFAGIKNLPSMRNYDPCFHLIAVQDAIYLASSADDAVHKIHAESGAVVWSYPTGGPVRVAPSFHAGKVYFGSDDGFAYCVDAETGKLVWRYSPHPDAEKLFNNGRAISFFPIRTGVLVRDGLAYFGASLLPWKASTLTALNAETGIPAGPGTFSKRFENQSMEGPLLATDDQLILPQGRVAPKLYSRKTGESLGSLKGSGGVFVVVTPDQHILHGPGGKNAKTGGLSDSSGKTAKIAAFEKGNALVVSGHWAFLLQADKVVAVDRSAGQVVWQQAHATPLDLVLAGDTLFVGSEDRVTAYHAEDGSVRWVAQTEGKVQGLVVAHGRLYASTELGRVHCFAEGDGPVAAVDNNEGERTDEHEEAQPSPNVERVRARGLVGRWVMHRSAMRTEFGESITETTLDRPVIQDQASRQHARLLGAGKSERFGELEAVYLDGSAYLEIAESVKQAQLPERRLSVEAWVRIDQPIAWGGIVGCFQDNGSFERGWLLGYRDKKFVLGLNAQGGKDALTYMQSHTAYQPGDWAHVVGTYDGKTMRLYINGRFEVSSEEQNGDIKYAETGPYVIGAYRDENEDFRMTGMIHEVRVYDTALRDRDVKALFERKSANFPEPSATQEDAGNFLASGPAVRFVAPGEAEVTWRTAAPSPSRIAFVRDDQALQIEKDAARTEHKARVTGLRRNAVYQFQITEGSGEEARTTRSFECDTHFNFTTGAVAKQDGLYSDDGQAEAKQAIERARGDKDRRGVILVAGFDDARLGYLAATTTRLNTIVVLDDEDRVHAERLKLIEAGVYGGRVTVMHAERLADLRLPPRSFNAVLLSADTGAKSEFLADARSLIQPNGRLVVDRKVAFVAPPIDGAGEWSHMYGTAENNSFGGESLGEATQTTELELQWIGRPGPRYQSDRQNRKPAPLAVGGRLYLQGLHRLITLDQYNGTVLWSMEIPEMQRWNVVRDSANWCADESHLYVAVLDELWKIDGATGEVVHIFRADGNHDAERTYDFGYVARTGGLIVGSSVRPGTIFTEWWGGENWYDQQDGEKAGKVGSDRVFALDAETGERRWTYDKGLALNPTIVVTDDRVYFVQATNPKVTQSDQRRLFDPAMWEGLELVALDLKTGRTVYKKPIAPTPGKTAFYMVHARGKLLISSSGEKKFSLYCLEAKDGEPAWDTQFAWEADHHGKHLSRPAVSGNYVYLRPKVLDLMTGSTYQVQFPKGHQCGSYALTTKAWFARAGSMTMWSIDQEHVSRWERLRPDCWLSTIPAGGMLLSPEGGGGCSCGTWIETSMGFMPRKTRKMPVQAPRDPD